MQHAIDNMPGIITVPHWTMAPNGDTYLYFWCAHWEIITDKQVPIEGFRSTEKWQLLARNAHGVIAAFPGCQIKAWLRCEKGPIRNSIYRFGESGEG